MAEGIERWPCIPRVSGLKKLRSEAERLERTSGNNECCSVPSPRSFPACNLCEAQKKIGEGEQIFFYYLKNSREGGQILSLLH